MTRRTFLLFCVLLAALTTRAADKQLIVERNNGTKVYFLLSEQPELTFSGPGRMVDSSSFPLLASWRMASCTKWERAANTGRRHLTTSSTSATSNSSIRASRAVASTTATSVFPSALCVRNEVNPLQYETFKLKL